LCSRFGGTEAQAKLLLGSLAAAACAWQLAANYERSDHSESHFVEDYGRSILASMPQNALLMLSGDILVNSVRYLQQCEGLRPDVVAFFVPTMTWKWFVPQQKAFFPNVTFPGTHYHPGQPGGWSMLQFFEANHQKFPDIFVCGGWYSGDDTAEKGYDKVPHGMCERMVRKGSTVDFDKWRRESYAALPRYPLPDITKYDETTWERNVFQESFKANHTRAFYALMHGMTHANLPLVKQQHAFKVAVEGYEQVIRDHPEPRPDYYYKNLGISYTRAAAALKSNEMNRKGGEAFARYISVAPSDDKDLDSIKAFVKSQGM